MKKLAGETDTFLQLNSCKTWPYI